MVQPIVIVPEAARTRTAAATLIQGRLSKLKNLVDAPSGEVCIASPACQRVVEKNISASVSLIFKKAEARLQFSRVYIQVPARRANEGLTKRSHRFPDWPALSR